MALNAKLVQQILHEYPTWTPKGKAAFVTVCVLVLWIVVILLAYHTGHAYLPLIGLGIFYGWLLSYPVMKFFGATIQAAIGGFLGGITLANIGSKEAAVRSAIQSAASTIVTLVRELGPEVVNPGGHADNLGWNWMDTAVVYCIWMTIITVFLIVAVNAHFSSRPPSAAS
jgi:hypothetical protein